MRLNLPIKVPARIAPWMLAGLSVFAAMLGVLQHHYLGWYWLTVIWHAAVVAIAVHAAQLMSRPLPSGEADTLLQTELEALGPSLQILQRQVRTSIDKSEAAVMSAVGRLTEIQALSSGLHTEATSAIDRSNTISVQMQQLSAESQECLNTFEAQQQAWNAQQSTKNAKVAQAMHDVASLTPLVDMITGIAKQTHLLSFNAAIEAARAGDAGNGFKIVATEVRTLAQQTTEVAQRIEEGIAKVQAAVRSNSSGEGNDVQQMVVSMQRIRSLLERNVEQSAELAPYLQQLSQGMDQGTASIRDQVVDTMGQMQFQDVLRQLLEQVDSALEALAQRAVAWSQGDISQNKLVALLQEWEAGYVMLEQRLAHQSTGSRPAQSVGAPPSIELF